MPGFKLRRPGDQTIAIDSSYFNLGLRQSGAISLDQILYNGGNSGTKSYFRSITVNSDQAIIAYRCDQLCALWNSTRQNGQTTFTFVCLNQPATLYYWVFDLPKYAQQFAVGGKFIVRKPTSGETVFDSRNKYLKTIDFYQNTSGENVSRDYGKTPAIVMVKRSWNYVRTITSTQQFYNWISSFSKTNGNNVQFTTQPYVTGTDNNLNSWYPSGQSARSVIMVIDVQNY